MAYMNQERKGIIAGELKRVMPQGWKWSLSVQHHSTIVLTISEAPVDLIREYRDQVNRRHHQFPLPQLDHLQINEFWLLDQFEGERLEQMTAIRNALNGGNWDKSDIQTDYFNVGWYVSINFGRWNKPFRVTGQKAEAA